MILTYTGKTIDPFNIKLSDICIEDIAHGLSLLCRYSGQCNRFFSVAEHSIIMAVYSGFRKYHPLAMLLHDAAEAYIGDIIRPVKRELSQFRQFETNFITAITYKLTDLMPSVFATVKSPDNIMLATEAYRMMNGDIDVSDTLIDLNIPFYYFDPLEAERRFLSLYKELTCHT